MKKSLIAVLTVLFALPQFVTGAPSAEIPCFVNPLSIKLDGILNEPFWQKAGKIDSFHRFRHPGTPAKSPSQVLMCLDSENLYVALNFKETVKITPGKATDSLWKNDNADMIFSSIAHKDWYRQIAFSLNGKSYEEFIGKDDYRKALHIEKNGWSAELVIPRRCLGKFSDHDLRFNILRKRANARETQSWCNVTWALEPANFGTLHITMVPDEVVHGPWNSSVTSTSAVISWETAGACPGKLFIRKKGEKEFRAVAVETRSGVADGGAKLHHLSLQNLTPGTIYEYHTGLGPIRTFRTLETTPGEFSFAFTSDIHCNSAKLKEILRSSALSKVDFLFLGGDLITGISGRYSCYAAFLDTLGANWSKAAYCFRGNHEYRGFPEPFMELTAPLTGKSYGIFSHKGVCFLYLDSGDGKMLNTRYMQKQFKFLESALKSQEFKNARFRVLLIHHPMFEEKKWGSPEQAQIYALLKKHKAAEKIDLMLAGHLHSYNRLLAGETKLHSTNPNINGRVFKSPLPFPVLVNDVSGTIVVKAGTKSLEVTVRNRDAKVIDKLSFKSRK